MAAPFDDLGGRPCDGLRAACLNSHPFSFCYLLFVKDSKKSAKSYFLCVNAVASVFRYYKRRSDCAS